MTGADTSTDGSCTLNTDEHSPQYLNLWSVCVLRRMVIYFTSSVFKTFRGNNKNNQIVVVAWCKTTQQLYLRCVNGGVHSAVLNVDHYLFIFRTGGALLCCIVCDIYILIPQTSVFLWNGSSYWLHTVHPYCKLECWAGFGATWTRDTFNIHKKSCVWFHFMKIIDDKTFPADKPGGKNTKLYNFTLQHRL